MYLAMTIETVCLSCLISYFDIEIGSVWQANAALFVDVRRETTEAFGRNGC